MVQGRLLPGAQSPEIKASDGNLLQSFPFLFDFVLEMFPTFGER